MTAPARRSDKRRDLLDGALVVFGADGYTRASIDAIARAAGVSSRTIYNRFGDKAGLFEAVIVDSSRRVADAQVALAAELLGDVPAAADAAAVEAALIAFGRAWASLRAAPDPAFAPHFALVRQVTAEAGHIPAAALRAWQEEGPLRVRRAIAGHLRRIADAGQLHIDDAEAAAVQLVVLAAEDVLNRTFAGVLPMARAEVHRISDAGVRTFLYGHAGLRAGSHPRTG